MTPQARRVTFHLTTNFAPERRATVKARRVNLVTDRGSYLDKDFLDGVMLATVKAKRRCRKKVSRVKMNRPMLRAATDPATDASTDPFEFIDDTPVLAVAVSRVKMNRPMLRAATDPATDASTDPLTDALTDPFEFIDDTPVLAVAASESVAVGKESKKKKEPSAM